MDGLTLFGIFLLVVVTMGVLFNKEHEVKDTTPQQEVIIKEDYDSILDSIARDKKTLYEQFLEESYKKNDTFDKILNRIETCENLSLDKNNNIVINDVVLKIETFSTDITPYVKKVARNKGIPDTKISSFIFKNFPWSRFNYTLVSINKNFHHILNIEEKSRLDKVIAPLKEKRKKSELERIKKVTEDNINKFLYD